jgi:hypothetical protein
MPPLPKYYAGQNEIAAWRGKSETTADFNVRAVNELRESSKTNSDIYSVTCLYYGIKEVCIPLAYSLNGTRKESVGNLNTHKTKSINGEDIFNIVYLGKCAVRNFTQFRNIYQQK